MEKNSSIRQVLMRKRDPISAFLDDFCRRGWLAYFEIIQKTTGK